MQERCRPSDSPNVHAYLTVQTESQNVYLVPNNSLPLQMVTKRELLDMAETSIENLLKTEMERVQQQFTNEKVRQYLPYTSITKCYWTNAGQTIPNGLSLLSLLFPKIETTSFGNCILPFLKTSTTPMLIIIFSNR
jgi:hypothetical protein